MARRTHEWKGEAVEKEPPGKAEREADRAAGRAPLDARTGQPIEDPAAGRLERPDVGGEASPARAPGVDAEEDDGAELADTGDVEPHDKQ
jgi:hypothetical protein